MSLSNKIKNFFITLISSAFVGVAFFIFTIIALLTSWIVFLFFSLITLCGIFIE